MAADAVARFAVSAAPPRSCCLFWSASRPRPCHGLGLGVHGRAREVGHDHAAWGLAQDEVDRAAEELLLLGAARGEAWRERPPRSARPRARPRHRRPSGPDCAYGRDPHVVTPYSAASDSAAACTSSTSRSRSGRGASSGSRTGITIALTPTTVAGLDARAGRRSPSSPPRSDRSRSSGTTTAPCASSVTRRAAARPSSTALQRAAVRRARAPPCTSSSPADHPQRPDHPGARVGAQGHHPGHEREQAPSDRGERDQPAADPHVAVHHERHAACPARRSAAR